ncbi:MAG TPA: hypothetical protein PKJ63_09330 [Cyclobacteriaceae bacterium]|nr:hypothetical protein [Cyclobacteriaceae bacterium]
MPSSTLIRLPLVFLLVASLIGLALRFHFVQPITGFNYNNWLHAHSHVMFLGWVLNALCTGFVVCLLPASSLKRYTSLLYTINVLVFGMLITFPLQGYGVYSIIISTLHTIAIVVFTVQFFKDTRWKQAKSSVQFARDAMIFFLVSALGPLIVGVLAANGLGQSDWYHLAIYYYLHFQYNGVFTFGILALFFTLLERKGVGIERKSALPFRKLLFFSCFPAYALSTLWTEPPMLIIWIGLAAAILQIASLYYFLQTVRNSGWNLRLVGSNTTRALLLVSFLAFIAKLVLQFLSSIPKISLLAYEVRFYLIAYLHLVLVGMISFFLIAWYREQKVIALTIVDASLLVAGFVGSELIMVGVGLSAGTFNVFKWVLVASVILFAGIVKVAISAIFARNLVP